MKNIIIIDDDFYKREYVKNELNQVYEDVNYMEYDTKKYALMHLAISSEEVDMVVLGWTFKDDEESNAVYENGLEILNFMKNNNLDLNTIIIAQDEVNLNDDYDNLKAIIKYNPYVSIKDKIQSLKLKNKDKIKILKK